MAQYDITASGNQLIIQLIVTDGDFAPNIVSLKNPSIKLTTDRIKFYDSGVYNMALFLEQINEINSVSPIDLEDASDKIIALIANFNGGGDVINADFIKPIKYGKIELPTEFNNDIPFELYRDSDSLIKHTLDVNSRYKGGTKIYVASTGNDTTGDGSEPLPYKTLTKAITVAVAGGDLKYEILVNNEFLNRDENIFNQTISNKTIAVISTNENKTITSSNSTYAWTLDGTGTYKATRTGVLSTIDFLNKDVFGLPIPLKQVSTLLLCQSEAGTWYTDGSIVWVHRTDGLIPTNLNTGVNIGVIGIDPQLGTNGVLYFENFIFCGWQNGVSLRVRNSVSSGSGELCVSNCFFVGKKGLTSNGNCLSVVGLKNAYVLNCISAYGQRDGFNYTYDTLSTRLDRELCTYFEYNCLAYDLGLVEAGSLSNNVSSAHNGVKGIRVGTIGYNNTGATIHDVTGCISVLYDCRLRHPVTGGVYGSGASYFFSSDGDGVSKGVAFLNNCSATNNTNALIVGATQVVNIDKFVYTGSVINGGTINYID